MGQHATCRRCFGAVWQSAWCLNAAQDTQTTLEGRAMLDEQLEW